LAANLIQRVSILKIFLEPKGQVDLMMKLKIATGITTSQGAIWIAAA
jgi:hypothetical protein